MTTASHRSSLCHCGTTHPSFLAVLILCFGVVFFCQPVASQTLTVLHTFPYYYNQPAAGLGTDSSGALYGTTSFAYGTAFRLKQHDGNWLYSLLFNFPFGGTDQPEGPLLVAPDGTLYGTSQYINNCYNCGSVFHLYPFASVPRTALSPWNQSVLYSFTGGSDGGTPSGALLMDSSGNPYGTTERGGPSGDGVIYEIEHGTWTESVLFSPQNQRQGVHPLNGVVADNAGNLFGVFQRGGPNGPGAVYELTNSGSGWTEQITWAFTGGSDGQEPVSVIIDPSGNLFGATSGGGTGLGGVIFKLTHGSGGWSFTPLYDLTGSAPCGVRGRLTLDNSGNLFGVTYCDGALGQGSIFELAVSGGSYTFIDLYDFTGGSDTSLPNGDLVIDAQGNLYGTTIGNGGIVFQLSR
jgi:uncharacterized repeat protein (TIGR03803 family)